MSDRTALDIIPGLRSVRPNYIRPAERLPCGVSFLHREPRLQQSKAKSEFKAEAHAILSYHQLRMSIPSGQVEYFVFYCN